MDFFLDDLVNEIVHQVQDKVVPTLEKVAQTAKQRLSTPRPPPSSTDLVYLTDRLIVSSQPAPANPPRYDDVGRDALAAQQRLLLRKRQTPAPISSSSPTKNTTPALEAPTTPPPATTTTTTTTTTALERHSPSSPDSVAKNPSEEPRVTEGTPDNVPTTSSSPAVENPQEGRVEMCMDDSEHDESPNEQSKAGRATQANNDVEQIEPRSSSHPSSINADDNDSQMNDATSSSVTLSNKVVDEERTHEIAQGDDSIAPMESKEEKVTEPPKQEELSIPNEEEEEVLGNDMEKEPSAQEEQEVLQQELSVDEMEEQQDGPPTSEPLSESPSSTREKKPESETDPQSPEKDKDPVPQQSSPINVADGSKSKMANGEASGTRAQTDISKNNNSAAGETQSIRSEEAGTMASTEPLVGQQSAEEERQAMVVDDDENDLGPMEEPAHQTASTPQHHAPIKNSPANIVTYLEKRHGRNHYLAYSLMDQPPDDRTLLLFRRQIVQLGWWSPCIERSETPSIPKVLKTCYAIHCYLQLHPSNVALVYCSNGKTRTAIAMACYLKFAGLVQHSYQGFFHFLTKRGISNPEATWKQLPPSLHLFFRQFDTAVELGGFLNRKPLLLRAIALQGIPVEDKPCLDIWDSAQKHVYSSHPESWNEDLLVRKGAPNNSGDKPTSQWADEEGFYKVNVVLEGDFLMLCRFGGDFAKETTIHDPSKILFRYANTTGFLSGGCPYELPPHKVDLMRQYAPHLDDDDFLVTLLFEAEWERLDDDDGDGLRTLPNDAIAKFKEQSSVRSERVWKSHQKEACEEGWKVIFQQHSARPNALDIDDFRNFYQGKDLERCSDHLICLSLQLSNFEYQRAANLLSESSFAWWQHGLGGKRPVSKEGQRGADADYDSLSRQKVDKNDRALATQEILDILGGVDVTMNLEYPDIRQMQGSDKAVSSYRTKDENMNAPERKVGFSRDSGNNLDDSPLMDPCLREFGWMAGSMTYPRPGDITELFGTNYQQFHSRKLWDRYKSTPGSIVAQTRPRMPFFRRDRPTVFPPSAKRQRKEGTGEDSQLHVPFYDARQEAAMQLLLEVRHTGIDLPGLIDLVESSREWSDVSALVDEGMAAEEIVHSFEASMNREAKKQQQKKWEKARSAEDKEKEEKKLAQDAKKKEEEEQKSKEAELVAAKEDLKPSVGSPENTVKATDDIPLKDDPEFAKYFKMLKMGMAKEQVLHAMKRDDKDLMVLDMDPSKSLRSQLPAKQKNADEVPLKDDPVYQKYFKMLKMGLPMGAVKNAMSRDEKDPSIMDLDPNKSLQSQRPEPKSEEREPALQDDPDYEKYFKMLKMGLPVGAVKNALARDGKDPSILDLDPKRSLKSQTESRNEVSDDDPPLKDDPDYAKFFKMLSMGLPMGAVKNALVRDGKDPAIMELDPNKSVKSQLGGATEERDTGVPLKDDPEYLKYFKMLAMGLPKGAVKNALERDGKNASIIDLDPNKSVAFQMKKSGSTSKKPAKKKKRVRRKKIYWNPIDPGKLKEDSMWNIVRGSIVMNKLNYDLKEFEDLFTESADPADSKKKDATSTKAAKKLVQVIDGKRDMNGGIILARLKTENDKIAEIVKRIGHGKFDATQLKALKEYLPDADERRGLIAYMKKGESAKEVKDKLYADLSATEKYMVTMMDIPDVSAKFDAMLFRTVFKNRFEEMTAAIRTLNKACDELRSSVKLRKLMAMILTVVNQINTGGEGKMAMGFTLDALLKLNEAKAFDKKTSVLHYVVKVVKKNDENLLSFPSELGSVTPAEGVLLDVLTDDVESLLKDLKNVHATVKRQAEDLEKAGELRPMSLSELIEQRTTVQHVGLYPQYNKINHLTGRTSMERFTLTAKVACEQATESISDVKKKYSTLLQYFGEDEKMASADFFGILRRFMAEWGKAIEQVEAIEKKRAKEKRRAAAKAAKKAKKAAKSKSGKMKQGDLKKRGLQGVASLAAAKALKKASSDEKKVEGALGGITSMSAAISERGSKKERAFEGVSSLGGIAAMAAAAAAKSGTKEERRAGGAPPLGGIAAMAAAAAASKRYSGNERRPGSGSQLGGIAPMAAAAASSRQDVKEERGPEGGSQLGRIAGMAAAHAASRNGGKEKSGYKSDSQLDGIAAMAAAAAASKAKSKQERGLESGSQLGGIAAMAAAAAASKAKSKEESGPESGSQLGGIAAMAAAAAASKARSKEESGPESGSQLGGIAAMAASAAASKGSRKEKSGPESGSQLGGIAAMAAAAAAQRKGSKEEERSKADSPVGGITAMAAAAIFREKCNTTEESELSTAVVTPRAEFIGGITTSAAAAIFRGKDKATEGSERSIVARSEGKGDANEILLSEAKRDGSDETNAHIKNKQSIVSTLERSQSEGVGSEKSHGSTSLKTEGITANAPFKKKQSNGITLERSQSDGARNGKSEGSTALKTEGFTAKSPFAAKAAAYRKRKSMKDKSSVAAYRERKSNRDDLQIEVTEVLPDKMIESKKNESLAQKCDDETTNAPQEEKSEESSSIYLPVKNDEEEGSIVNGVHSVAIPARELAREEKVENSGIFAESSESVRGEREDQLKPEVSQPGIAGPVPQSNTNEPGEQSGLADSQKQILPPEKSADLAAVQVSEVTRDDAKVDSLVHSFGVTSLSLGPRQPNVGVDPLHSNSFGDDSINSESVEPSLQGGGVSLGSFVDDENQPMSLSSFIEQSSSDNLRSELLRQNFDDSSVAKIAKNLQRQPIDSAMSETWTEGDGISNWMGWADQVIKISDTESVQGFESSRDLNDANGIDDDSTVNTNFDDSTVNTNFDDSTVNTNFDDSTINTSFDDDSTIASAITPGNVTNHFSFDDGFENPDTAPARTPAQVAASILFADSDSSIDNALSIKRGQDQNLIDMGLSFVADDVRLDPGLSFGVDDVGFDDGLGFGNGFGGEDLPVVPQAEKNPERRKKWFAWGKNRSEN